ncbi:MAG: PTS transporter subunit IIC [Rikenellaceae bacterium]
MEIFEYIIGLGAAVMMPIIFTILGICLGIKPAKALHSGLFVGVGFVGLGVITALLTSTLGPVLSAIVQNYGLELEVFDMGWPAAAAVAYNAPIVGALIIPICLAVNVLMLVTKTTRTVNIDLWNYWHFAFIGAVVYFASDSIGWGLFAAIICYTITMVMADFTAKHFQEFYGDVDGISLPQPFVQGFVPFAIVLNKAMDAIPGFDKLNIDAEGMKKKFGILGEPLILGVIVGGIISGVAEFGAADGASIADKIKNILVVGVKMGAVMELIPRITRLFIEGLTPISQATKELIAKKFKNSAGLNIGMTPALVIGHPTILVSSLISIPIIILLSVVLPGNKFLPLASLAGIFYVFVMVLPITKGNVVKSVIIGLVSLVVGLYFVTDLAPSFSLAAAKVFEMTGDATVRIPDGFTQGASIDFASSLFAWVIYHLTHSFKIVGPAILVIISVVMMYINRCRIIKSEKQD